MMRSMKLAIYLCVGTACLGVDLPVAYADAGFSPQYDACMDASGGTTFHMIECMTTETERQDVVLNANYRAAMAGLDESRRTALREVQRLWIAYRDANCSFFADPDGGQMALVNGNGCVLEMTAERAAELGTIARSGF